MNKIGIGIITCDRPEYFSTCLASIPEGVGKIVVVNDGSPYSSEFYSNKVDHVIQHSSKKAVGISKNEALRWLIHNDCDLLFLIEDDMQILRPDVFEAYIHASEGSGIWHLNYGPATPFNRVQTIANPDLNNRHLLDNKSELQPRMIFQCENGSEIALYQHLTGCFSFFHRNVILNVGYHDERYFNAFEHVDHTYRIIRAGLHPPFWWFADLWDSSQYISEIEGSIQNSVIAKNTDDWKRNLQFAIAIYKHTHGHPPNGVVDVSEEAVKERLAALQSNYSRKIL